MWREHLEELRRFLIAEEPVLTRWPELLWQQAANQPRSSHVAMLAEQVEAARTRFGGPWLRWINHPDVPDPGPLLTIPAHRGEVSSITFTSDSHRIVSTVLNGTIAIWETRNGREVARLGGVSQRPSRSLWAPRLTLLSCAGGGRIAVARENGTVTGTVTKMVQRRPGCDSDRTRSRRWLSLQPVPA